MENMRGLMCHGKTKTTFTTDKSSTIIDIVADVNQDI